MSAPYRVVRASAQHLEGIRAISNQAIRDTAANFNGAPETLEHWRSEWEHTQWRYPWLVALDSGDHVLGFAKASAYKGRCAYDWTPEVTVYIDPAHHRKGLGRALYSRLLTLLRQQGFHTCVAGITRPNEPSEQLHAAMGFQLFGVLPQAGWKFERWHDVSYWQCRLQSAGWMPGAVHSVDEAWNDAPGTPWEAPSEERPRAVPSDRA